ncbi:MAG: potassium-transporting ATPase subunit KdpA [Rhodospirillales bacterium]|nr:potassium-transporting ATPase subunit KdpA [Rhodospirillales bacterium]
MTFSGWAGIGLYVVVLTLITVPLGGYLCRVFAGERTFLSPVLRPVEGAIYRLLGVDAQRGQDWKRYALAMVWFSLAGFVTLYALLRLQGFLPLNPAHLPGVGPDLSFDTAISFNTNTNWQSYAPEQTMGNLVQMAGLAVHNFLSAAVGIAIAIAMIRGFARKGARDIGNFWADVTRCVLYVLLPVSVLAALVLVWQGVPQTLAPAAHVTTLQGAAQVIARGPVASQEAIKMFGTNGGGFFNANSAHPFENPTAFSNFLEMLLMIAIGAALTNVFGRMVGQPRQGWVIYGVMLALMLTGVGVNYAAESTAPPVAALAAAPARIAPGGNLEGKEIRFGGAQTALFTTLTTDASCGAVNTMFDSMTPLGGAVPLVNILLGEVIFGGVGSGLYGMLAFAVVAVFTAGLMVGRTPEYLGKKITAREVKMAMIALLVAPFVILLGTALAVSIKAGLAGIANPGPHGFTEIFYAFASAAGNNGSAFAGLSANTPFYNVGLALVMIAGRFLFAIPLLAIAGSLAAKPIVPPSGGTFPTDGALFGGLLVGVILIVGGLTFFPALALGPIAEQFAMSAHHLF